MAAQRIYIIKPKTGTAKPRLVWASHPSNALRHVANDTLSVEMATHEELAALLPTTPAERIAQEQAEIES